MAKNKLIICSILSLLVPLAGSLIISIYVWMHFDQVEMSKIGAANHFWQIVRWRWHASWCCCCSAAFLLPTWTIHAERDPTQLWRHCIHVHLTFIGLLVFFVATTFLDLIGLFAGGECLHIVYGLCKTITTLDLSYRITRLVFTTLALTFCYHLRASRFLGSTNCRRTQITCTFCLSVVGAAAISSSLQVVLEELFNPLLNNSTATAVLVDCLGMAPRVVPNQTSDLSIERCIEKRTELHEFLDIFSPFLNPCMIEFLLLFLKSVFVSIGRIVNWSAENNGNDIVREGESVNNYKLSTNGGEYQPHASHHQTQQHSNDESQPLLGDAKN